MMIEFNHLKRETTPNEQMSLITLPRDMCLEIFHYLLPTDAASLYQTCKWFSPFGKSKENRIQAWSNYYREYSEYVQYAFEDLLASDPKEEDNQGVQLEGLLKAYPLMANATIELRGQEPKHPLGMVSSNLIGYILLKNGSKPPSLRSLSTPGLLETALRLKAFSYQPPFANDYDYLETILRYDVNPNDLDIQDLPQAGVNFMSSLILSLLGKYGFDFANRSQRGLFYFKHALMHFSKDVRLLRMAMCYGLDIEAPIGSLGALPIAKFSTYLEEFRDAEICTIRPRSINQCIALIETALEAKRHITSLNTAEVIPYLQSLGPEILCYLSRKGLIPSNVWFSSDFWRAKGERDYGVSTTSYLRYMERYTLLTISHHDIQHHLTYKQGRGLVTAFFLWGNPQELEYVDPEKSLTLSQVYCVEHLGVLLKNELLAWKDVSRSGEALKVNGSLVHKQYVPLRQYCLELLHQGDVVAILDTSGEELLEGLRLGIRLLELNEGECFRVRKVVLD